jgi:transcriptional regulator with XRE-family HTH domain
MHSGKEIKIARISADIKAIELSKKLGISNSKLSLIEKGHIECPEDIYEKIISILNIKER